MMFFGVDTLRNMVSAISAYVAGLKSVQAAELAAAAGATALRVGLDLLLNSLGLIGITLLVKGLTALVDKLIVTKEELQEVRREAVSGLEALSDSAGQLVKDGQKIDDLVNQYKAIATSGEGISGSEETLNEIQSDLIEKLGDQAKGLDLVNGKYEEQIELIKKVSDANYEDWKRQNAADIERAEKLLNYDIGWAENSLSSFGSEDRATKRTVVEGGHAQIFTDEEIEQADEFAASLYKVKGLSKDIGKVYKDIEGVTGLEGLFKTEIRLSGSIKNAKEQLGSIIDAYDKVENHDEKTLEALSKHYADLSSAIQQAESFMDSSAEREATPLENLNAVATENIAHLATLTEGLQDARAEWFKNLDDFEKGTGKTIDTIISALQSMAKGEGVSGEDFWSIMEFDANKTLTDIEMVGDKFTINEQQLIKLKDDYILRQMEQLKNDTQSLETRRQELSTTLEQAKVELQMLARRGGADATFRKELEGARTAITEAESSLSACEDQIRLNTARTEQWRSKLGNCRDASQEIADLQDKITKAQKEADEYAKAMTTSVQNVIDGFEKEKQALEDQKEILNEHLDILNEKKEAIEDTIEQYKSIVDVVKDISDAEIDALEARQEAEEEAVQSRIDALKEEKDQKEDAASLDEKQLELRKKLAELDKAKTTKVRTYSAARGWHFDVDAEAVSAAQSAADDAQKAYDTAVGNQKYDNEVKALEAQKKAISDNYKAQIKAQEDYYKQWSEITEAQEKAEKEQLAEQILGSNYREKIKDKDTGILNKFEGDFKSYNSQLNNLVNGEIASLQSSIKAKDEEIKAKGKQIDAWKRYKTEVETAISDVSNKYNNYLTQLKDVALTESSTYEDRENALKDFVQKFDNMTYLIEQYQSRVKALQFKAEFNDWEAREKMALLISDYEWAIVRMEQRIVESLTGYGIVNSPGDVSILEEAKRRIQGHYSQGGTADYTGLAMLHGSKNSSETIFNAAQSRELYDMVRSGSFAAQVADKAYMGLRTAMTKMNTTTNNSTNSNITIQQMTIKANNPMEFHSQFMQEMGQYWNVKLTESRIK